VAEKPGPDRQLDDEDVLRAVRDLYDAAVGTSEVADELGVATQTADKYLRRLSEQNYVLTRKIGQVRVWWLSADGKKRISKAT
jgi:Mn-dependent DtxR family transcriptional regulator